MVTIISGPSCAGKSTFLKSPRLSVVTGRPAKQPIVFPSFLMRYAITLKGDCFFHYNVLRLASQRCRQPQKRIISHTHFVSEPRWAEILKLPIPKKAVVLLVSRDVLIKRMSSRKHLEPGRLSGIISPYYPKKYWIDLIKSIDLDELYKAWCFELEENEIPYTLVNSSNEDYEIVSKDKLQALRLNE